MLETYKQTKNSTCGLVEKQVFSFQFLNGTHSARSGKACEFLPTSTTSVLTDGRSNCWWTSIQQIRTMTTDISRKRTCNSSLLTTTSECPPSSTKRQRQVAKLPSKTFHLWTTTADRSSLISTNRQRQRRRRPERDSPQ